jgi:hypothetical protein
VRFSRKFAAPAALLVLLSVGTVALLVRAEDLER